MRSNRDVWVSGILGALVALAFVPPAQAAGGDLDGSFGSGGIVQTTTYGSPQAVASTADGKVVAAGSELVDVAAGSGSPTRWVVRRYDAAGNLDASFASGGTFRLFGAFAIDEATDAVLDGSGRLLVAGISGISTGKRGSFKPALTVIRLTSTGVLDASFGAGGVVQTTSSSLVQWVGRQVLAVQPDGRIVVGTAGWQKGKGTSTFFGFVAARYLAGGALDTTFDADGLAFREDARAGIAYAGRPLGIQSDGRIVLGGDGADAWALVRFLGNGAYDATFAPAGGTSDRLWSVAIDASDRIVAVGRRNVGTTWDTLVRRYLPTGATDATFGASGEVLLSLSGRDMAFGVQVHPATGNLVVALGIEVDSGNSYFDTAPLRLLPSGAPDLTFGTGGIAGFTGAATDVWAFAVALRADGDVVTLSRGADYPGSGTIASNPRWILAAYLAD